jgi:hypothetical protein
VAFSYGDPSTGDKDAVRFLLGDTTTPGHLLEDGEITWALGRWKPIYDSVEYVASVLADNIAARYAQEASYSADGVSISLGPVGDQFRALAASLRSQHKSLFVGGSPDVGGITPYEQRSQDIKNFSFGTGMHDDISAGQQDLGDQGPPIYLPEYYPGT